MAEQTTAPILLAATFATPGALMAAVAASRGRRDLSALTACTPEPVAGLADALGCGSTGSGRRALLTALGVGAACFVVMTFATVWGDRLNIGGRPPFSWPSFVIPSLSAGVAIAAIVTFLAALVTAGLPRLNHPVFDIDGIERVTRDRYVLNLRTAGEHSDADEIEALLRHLPLPPLSIQRLPA